MEPNSQQGPSFRQQLFHSQQLPPPSQLHLPPVNTSRSSININTLPPLTGPSSSSSPSTSSASSRFPPPYPQRHPSPSLSWPHHRTSNSREDAHPHSQSQPHRGEPRQMKREQSSQQQQQLQQQQQQQQKQEADDSMPATSDFVKKLYKMLEDQSFAHVVSWGPHGDCFVVKDMNEFTKSILPRMFKHSNFASFVRQLNKYDFHKVKNTDDNQFGEHSWTFRHPDFHADRRDALENIKRKVPTQRKSLPSSSLRPTSGSPVPADTHTHGDGMSGLQAQTSTLTSHISALESHTAQLQTQTATLTSHVSSLESHSSQLQSHTAQLQSQVVGLRGENEALRGQVAALERNYQDVLVEMVNFQRNMAQQDGLMQNLIQYFLGVEGGKPKGDNAATSTAGMGPTTHTPAHTLHTQLTGTPSHNPFIPTPSAKDRNQNPFIPTQAQLTPRPVNPVLVSPGLPQQARPGQHPAQHPAQQQQQHSGQQQQGQGVQAQGQNPFLAAQEARQMMGDGAARASLVQMSELSRRVEGSGGSAAAGGGGFSRQEALARISEMHAQRMAASASSSSGSSSSQSQSQSQPQGQSQGQGQPGSEAFVLPPDVSPWDSGAHEGLQVFTLGHLLPRSEVEDENGNWVYAGGDGGQGSGGAFEKEESPGADAEEVVRPTPTNPPSSSSPSPSAQSSSGASAGTPTAKLRVRRSTFVPGWAVPPRVLLVDDDAVSRRLSSKFLQVFGCAIDVAVDGVGAVNKMNLEKYDLVLMDIVMPKLDGVSATSLIRQFDHMTPIISMTSNSKPSEIMTYYSSGMNDILPKPFTKEGLLDMLEKHLMHLKVIQQMSRVPRSVGVPPLSDGSFNEALAVGAAALSSSMSPSPALPLDPTSAANADPSMNIYEDDGRINPLAGMGLSDERYAAILRDLVAGESFVGVGVPEGFSLGMMGVSMNGMGMGAVGASGGAGQGQGGGGGEKRGLDDEAEMRDGKRGRFEVLE